MRLTCAWGDSSSISVNTSVTILRFLRFPARSVRSWWPRPQLDPVVASSRRRARSLRRRCISGRYLRSQPGSLPIRAMGRPLANLGGAGELGNHAVRQWASQGLRPTWLIRSEDSREGWRWSDLAVRDLDPCRCASRQGGYDPRQDSNRFVPGSSRLRSGSTTGRRLGRLQRIQALGFFVVVGVRPPSRSARLRSRPITACRVARPYRLQIFWGIFGIRGWQGCARLQAIGNTVIT